MVLQERYLQTLTKLEGVEDWLFLTEKWNPSLLIDSEYFSTSSRSSDQENIGNEAAVDWPSVLGVAREATPDAIKSAYHKAIKAYHSDLVANLGPKLRQVADEESKRINLAYEAARRERNFR